MDRLREFAALGTDMDVDEEEVEIKEEADDVTSTLGSKRRLYVFNCYIEYALTNLQEDSTRGLSSPKTSTDEFPTPYPNSTRR